MLKKYLSLLFMLSCWVGFAQVNQTYNFTSTTEGWTGFNHTTSYTCDTGSVRANIYSFLPTATLTSPSIGLSNGNPITMTFDTKAINWSGSNVAASDNAYTLLFEWGETASRSEEHTSELQSRENLVCRLLLEKK